MVEEQNKIDTVQRELKDLEKPLRKDVEILKKKIEITEREMNEEGKELEILEKAYYEKHKSYAKKLLVLNLFTQEKSLLTEQLNTILCDYEKKKEEKINELNALLNSNKQKIFILFIILYELFNITNFYFILFKFFFYDFLYNFKYFLNS